MTAKGLVLHSTAYWTVTFISSMVSQCGVEWSECGGEGTVKEHYAYVD